jgi:hypothetical protein
MGFMLIKITLGTVLLMGSMLVAESLGDRLPQFNMTVPGKPHLLTDRMVPGQTLNSSSFGKQTSFDYKDEQGNTHPGNCKYLYENKR